MKASSKDPHVSNLGSSASALHIYLFSSYLFFFAISVVLLTTSNMEMSYDIVQFAKCRSERRNHEFLTSISLWLMDEDCKYYFVTNLANRSPSR